MSGILMVILHSVYKRMEGILAIWKKITISLFWQDNILKISAFVWACKTGVSTVLFPAICWARSFLSGQKHILQLFYADWNSVGYRGVFEECLFIIFSTFLYFFLINYMILSNYIHIDIYFDKIIPVWSNSILFYNIL